MMEDVLNRPVDSYKYSHRESLTQEEVFVNMILDDADMVKKKLEREGSLDRSRIKELIFGEREPQLRQIELHEFKSEDDRIAYYYSKLNDAGRAEATRCFFNHLDEQSKKDVADYVQSLTTDTRYTSDTGALLPTDTTPHE